MTRLLEAIRVVNPAIRFYQASSSEMFGHVDVSPGINPHDSILEAPMVSQSSTATGSQLMLARATVSSPVPESYSITSPLGEEWNSSLARLAMESLGSS